MIFLFLFANFFILILYFLLNNLIKNNIIDKIYYIKIYR